MSKFCQSLTAEWWNILYLYLTVSLTKSSFWLLWDVTEWFLCARLCLSTSCVSVLECVLYMWSKMICCHLCTLAHDDSSSGVTTVLFEGENGRKMTASQNLSVCASKCTSMCAVIITRNNICCFFFAKEAYWWPEAQAQVWVTNNSSAYG